MTRQQPSSGPLTLENITISLTLACNQGCRHCWVDAGRSGTDELNDDEVRSVLTQARELGATHVKFTGGEPLLRRGFVGLLNFAYDSGFRISVETNGTTLTPQVTERLKGMFSRLHFYVSLDGASATTHDAFRGQRGAFDRTLQHLAQLRDAGAFFSIHTVVRRRNIAEIDDVLRLARSLGASQLKLILAVHEMGRGQAAQDEAITPEEMFGLLDALPPQRLWDYAWNPERSRNTVLMTTLPPAFQPDGAGTTCGWSRSFLAVLADGEVAICQGMYEFDQAKAGNVRNRSLAEIWLSSALFSQTRTWLADDLDGVCGNCAVAESCRGLCRANAIARYRDLRAPYPLCQTLYDAGLFPPAMLRDPDRYTPYRADRHSSPPVQPTTLAGPGRQLLPLAVIAAPRNAP